MNNIIIFGHKNSGKSTVGKALADHLKKDFFDLDLIIENLYLEEHKKTLSYKEIFIIHGETFFREMEKKAIESLSEVKESVISLGGGTLEDHSSHETIQKMGQLIYLNITFDTYFQRAKKRQAEDKEGNIISKKYSSCSLWQTYLKRNQTFDRLFAIKTDADHLSAKQVAEEIANAIK